MNYKNLGIKIRCPICGNYGTLVIKVKKGKYRQAYVIHWPDKQHYVSKFVLLDMGIDIDRVPLDSKNKNDAHPPHHPKS